MGAIPSRHTNLVDGVNSLMVRLNTRSGAAVTTSFIFSPAAILPSILLTVVFHCGKFAVLVKSPQIRSGLAWMLVATPVAIRKVLLLFVARPFGADLSCMLCPLSANSCFSPCGGVGSSGGLMRLRYEPAGSSTPAPCSNQESARLGVRMAFELLGWDGLRQRRDAHREF